MNLRWLSAVVVFIIVAGCQPEPAAVKSSVPQSGQIEGALKAEVLSGPVKKAAPAEAVAESVDKISDVELTKQLGINKAALLAGPTGQIRIDAASVMLLDPEPAARRILIDALLQSQNSAARVAVCRALSRTRTAKKPIEKKEDFIEPLFEILSTEEDIAQVKLAAEAVLIFEYERIGQNFEKLATDASLPKQARVNAAYALRLQPDIRAIVRLIRLLDEPDGEVVAEAEKALHSLGIPAGKDAATRNQIINELQRKGRDEFLKDWVIRQEAQVRVLETELVFWQRRYLQGLDRIYEGVADDSERGLFLAELLTDSKEAVRLWAIEKVYQGRVGTVSKLPVELGPILIELISDPDRDVRLQTARVLSLMSNLNSSRKLLQQLEVEQDAQVKREFFVALGGACHYAFSPNSEYTIPEQIRTKTLEWAERYLADADAAQAGAEVIKKLLEQDGLKSEQVDKYLGLLAERYGQQKAAANGTNLAAELVNAMASLCAKSVYKQQAAKRFAPLFEEALGDESEQIRQAAVDGLIYVDKAAAVKKFRAVLFNDPSAAIRHKIIDLVGEAGSAEDLEWLAEKMTSTAAKESAWQAMLKIFRRCRLDVVAQWSDRFEKLNDAAPLDEQKLVLLEMAEGRAAGENDADMIKKFRTQLAQIYIRQEKFDKAADYLGMLRESAEDEEQKQAILISLVDVYLKWPRLEPAVQLINNKLLEADLGPQSDIVRVIDNYLNTARSHAQAKDLLDKLGENVPSDRPLWTEQLNRWRGQFESSGSEQ